jgi:hypothetical protein
MRGRRTHVVLFRWSSLSNHEAGAAVQEVGGCSPSGIR